MFNPIRSGLFQTANDPGGGGGGEGMALKARVADIDDTRSDLDSFIERHSDKLVLPEDRTK